jgi:hypothetical protein
MAHLKVVAEHIGDRSFEELDREDLKDVVEWI